MRGVELEQLAAGAHPVERERRERARGDHDPHARAAGGAAATSTSADHLRVARDLLEVVEHEQVRTAA